MEIQKTRLWIKETSNDKVHRFTAKKKKKKQKSFGMPGRNNLNYIMRKS